MRSSLVIGGVMVSLALLLRLPLLNGSFWLDEAAQALESARPLSQQLDIVPDFQPPLLHLLVHLALYFGRSEWWLRMVGAVVPALLTVGALYWLAREVAGKTGAIWASLLLATNSLHVFFSQELRPYSLATWWVVLSWASLWWRFQTHSKPQTRWWWLFHGVVNALGLYTSYLYPFALGSQLILVWWQWRISQNLRILKLFGLSLAVSVGLFAFWLPSFVQQLAAGTQLKQNLPGWSEVVSTPQLKALPLLAGKVIFGVIELDATLPVIAGSMLLALSLVITAKEWWYIRPSLTKSRREVLREMIIFFGCWVVVPVLASWLVSFVVPVIQPKRVLFIVPGLYLGLMYFVGQLKSNPGKYLLPSVLLLINLWSLVTYWQQPRLQREDWLGLHAEIIKKYPPQDSVAVFAFDESFAPWRWYDDGSYPTITLGAVSIRQVADVPQRLKNITNYRYVLVFDYLRTLSDPQDQLLHEVAAYGYTAIDILDRPNIGFVRVYAREGEVVGWR